MAVGGDGFALADVWGPWRGCSFCTVRVGREFGPGLLFRGTRAGGRSKPDIGGTSVWTPGGGPEWGCPAKPATSSDLSTSPIAFRGIRDPLNRFMNGCGSVP